MKVLTTAMGTQTVPSVPFQWELWAVCTVSRALGPEEGAGPRVGKEGRRWSGDCQGKASRAGEEQTNANLSRGARPRRMPPHSIPRKPLGGGEGTRRPVGPSGSVSEDFLLKALPG